MNLGPPLKWSHKLQKVLPRCPGVTRSTACRRGTHTHTHTHAHTHTHTHTHTKNVVLACFFLLSGKTPLSSTQLANRKCSFSLSSGGHCPSCTYSLRAKVSPTHRKLSPPTPMLLSLTLTARASQFQLGSRSASSPC